MMRNRRKIATLMFVLSMASWHSPWFHGLHHLAVHYSNPAPCVIGQPCTLFR